MATLFSLIASIPSLLRALEWFAEGVRLAQIKKQEADMAKAITAAQATKDTSAIDKLFNPDKK